MLKVWPKSFSLRFSMEGDRPLLQIELYLPWESLLKVARAIRWAARSPQYGGSVEEVEDVALPDLR